VATPKEPIKQKNEKLPLTPRGGRATEWRLHWG